jgi:hypothetical protein
MASIYHPTMAPLLSPQSPYVPQPSVIDYRLNADGSIAQELYRRNNGTLGYRYAAWVNFSDAGGGAHHMWWSVEPPANLVTDELATARQVAEAHAYDCGVEFAPWCASTNA